MTTPISLRATSRERGFTLVELLVVISIIGTLVALLLPAVQTARERARQATCKANLKQLGIGMISYGSSKQKYPGYVQPLQRNDKTWLTVNIDTPSTSNLNSLATTEELSSQISWAAVIQPQLGRNDLYDNFLDGAVIPPDARAGIRPEAILLCPSDDDLTSISEAAGMSYIVNTGAWDHSGTTSPASFLGRDPGTGKAIPGFGDTKDNGLMHNLTLGSVRNRPGALKDGDTNTLMLSENIHKELDNAAYTWVGVGGLASSNTLQFAEQVFGMVWVVDDSPIANGTQVAFSSEDLSLPDFPQNTADYARPASNHASGVFNVVMADGHAESLDPAIDYVVYQQLMTTKGRDCVDPNNHNAIAGPITTFRTAAPISSASY